MLNLLTLHGDRVLQLPLARDARMARLVVERAAHVRVAHLSLAAHPRQEEGHGLRRARVEPVLESMPARGEGASAKDRLQHRPEACGARPWQEALH